MRNSENEVGKYCNQIDEIVSQMHEDDFYETHAVSRMKEMLATLKGAEEQLSAVYTIQEEKMNESCDKNGGGADNKEAHELKGELREIDYYCEIARDFIPELEAMLQKKDETEEEIENPEEEYFGGLPNMRDEVLAETAEMEVDLEEEFKNQTVNFDGEVEKEYKEEAKEIIEDREIVGKKPTDVTRAGEVMKRELMNQIGKTLNPEESKQKVSEKEEEREEERQK